MSTLTVPNSFAGGENRSAAELNANFDEIENWANGNIDKANLSAALQALLIPSGSIVATGGSAAPTGWLMCEGQAVSRATYADLFTALGTSYGVGDGTTTFNLPNLKGRVPVGRDAAVLPFDTLGETGGHKDLHNHSHPATTTLNQKFPVPQANATENWVGIKANDTPGGTHTVAAVLNTNSVTGASQTGATGDGNGQNLQPYQVVNYMIKT